MRVESDGLSTVLYSYGGLSERTEVTVWGDGSTQESIKHPDLIGILVFRSSGYTQGHERQRMDEDFGMAWLSGLSQRDQRSEEDPEVVGATEAWEPRPGVLGLWPAGLQDCGDL